MHFERLRANDGCSLAFQTSLSIELGNLRGGYLYPPCVLLMHGFSGSSNYFTRNFDALSKRFWVVAPDMRGHGSSGRTPGGYHVARLAADLHGLVSLLRRLAPGLPIVPVGCSIGAAVLWTYVELFGWSDFAGFVFVDQAPLQDRSPFDAWDASKAHTGCYDEATLLEAQKSWMQDTKQAHLDLVKGCLGYRHAPKASDTVSEEQAAKDEAFFTQISASCDQSWLARLLADHTRYDHREAIERIPLKTLVMAGRRSGCFPLEGMLETVRRMDRHKPGLAKSSIFDSGHWLFYEEPERFNREISTFVEICSFQYPGFIERDFRPQHPAR